jgi:hypothetical protein
LRFLSWFLLKKDIQTTTHDSIEDARYALLLYKLYEQFEADGRFEDVMEDIFAEGQKVVRSPSSVYDLLLVAEADKQGFKPPQDRTASPAPAAQKVGRNRSNGPFSQGAPPPQPIWGAQNRSQGPRDGLGSAQHPRRRGGHS